MTASPIKPRSDSRLVLTAIAIPASGASAALSVSDITFAVGPFIFACVVLAPGLLAFTGIVVDAFQLPLSQYIGLKPSTAALIGTSGAILCLVGLGIRHPARIRSLSFLSRWPAVLLLLILLWGMIIGATHLPIPQVVLGVEFLITPLLVAAAGILMSRNSRSALLYACIPILLANAVASLYQRVLGTEALLGLGYAYGTNVRTSDGILRAPGLFATNYQLGMFAAVTLMLVLQTSPPIPLRRFALPLRIITAVLSLTCLATSNYRTGLLCLSVGAFALVVFRTRGALRSVRLLITLLCGCLLVFFFISGWLSDESLLARFGVWQSAWSNDSSLLGNGVGSAGSASLSSISATSLVTDNYFLNVWLQLGLAGLPLIVSIMWAITRGVVYQRQTTNTELAFALASTFGIVATFITSDAWEHTASMSLYLFVLAPLFVQVSTNRAEARPDHPLGV